MRISVTRCRSFAGAQRLDVRLEHGVFLSPVHLPGVPTYDLVVAPSRFLQDLVEFLTGQFLRVTFLVGIVPPVFTCPARSIRHRAAGSRGVSHFASAISFTPISPSAISFLSARRGRYRRSPTCE